MSKSKIELLKSKIESKAKNLSKEKENKKEKYLIPKNMEEETKQNHLNVSSNTLKDSLSILEEFKNSLYPNLNIKKLETNYCKNYQNINLYKRNNLSSFCTKGTTSSDNINRNSSDLCQEDKIITDNKKIKSNLNNTICAKHRKEEIIPYDENKIINYLFNKINIEQIKELKNIYEQLIRIFNNIKNISKKEEKEKSNDNKSNNDYKNINVNIYNSKILSFQYIKALLSKNIEYFTKIFYNSIEFNKFILYQIYLFLSLIYLKEETINEYLLLSYKTILLYSSKKFDNILKISTDFKLFNDEKINKNIIILNKIIISILKTLTNIPSNQQILLFINPINYIIENNNYNLEIEDIIEKRISGINNLLILLKDNKDLNEKMLQIGMNEVMLIDANDNIDKYEVEEVILNKNENESQKSETEKILPEFDINKYKYCVIFELDETLVHYCEDNDNYFVKVRFGCESFIQYLNNFCEVIIASTSGVEYTEIIIDNLNKNNCLINFRIISDNYKDLDLSKINRDMKKTLFICHKENFLNAPKSNIIKLKEFKGEEDDKIFVKLNEEFQKIEGNKFDDIRNIISLIQKKFI